MSKTSPLTPTDYQIGFNYVNELIEKYSKMDKNDVIDTSTAKNFNSQLMKYNTELPKFISGTKFKTVISKLNDYKILIDAQIVGGKSTGISNEPPTSSREHKESSIPIPTKHKK